VDFIYTASVDSELATLCISGIDKLWYSQGWQQNWGEEGD